MNTIRSFLGSLAKGLGVVAIILGVLIGSTHVLPGIMADTVSKTLSAINPFKVTTTDRTGPSVLKALEDLSEFRAARGYYETVVDIDRDTNNLPDWISGERVLYVAKGDVDAFVDFSELDERRVVITNDGTTATVNLPAPTVSTPVLDLESSYRANLDEGLINRFRGSELERDAQLQGVDQMAAAAAEEGKLIGRAEENTTTMLQGLFAALGYTDVTITFDDAVEGPSE